MRNRKQYFDATGAANVAGTESAVEGGFVPGCALHESPSLFGTLIHSCYSKTQRSALGQIWIGLNFRSAPTEDTFNACAGDSDL